MVGTADDAVKLKNARSIGINVTSTGNNAGKVKGAGVDFDGTSNISIDGNLMTSGVTAAAYGSKNTIPKITASDRDWETLIMKFQESSMRVLTLHNFLLLSVMR